MYLTNIFQSIFDFGKFLSLINDQHKEPRRYKCSIDGLEEVKRVRRELKQIDRDSNFGFDYSLKLICIDNCKIPGMRQPG